MTDKDIKLIAAAKKSGDYFEVVDMGKKADTAAAKEILHKIAGDIYHREEYEVGIL
jgi:hypothetical protein